MFLTRQVAALALLGVAVATDAYVPVHKRFTFDVAVNDFSYLGMLSKRDACSDAFGDNAHNSNCAPDFTLCCRASQPCLMSVSMANMARQVLVMARHILRARNGLIKDGAV